MSAMQMDLFSTGKDSFSKKDFPFLKKIFPFSKNFYLFSIRCGEPDSAVSPGQKSHGKEHPPKNNER